MKKPIQFPGTFRPPQPPRMEFHNLDITAGCMHYPINFIVNETEGTVLCKDCGRTLNPVWVMKQLYFLVEDNLKRLAKRKRK